MPPDHLTAILADLPDMPREVAQNWLLPHAQRHGFSWPPPEGESDGPWAQILVGRPLDWWRARTWHCEPLPLPLDVMSHAVRFQVPRLIAAAEAGEDYLADSCARIAGIRRYIDDAGTWPVPVVGYPDSDGLGLADGHHRFAALEMARAAGGDAVADRHLVWLALP